MPMQLIVCSPFRLATNSHHATLATGNSPRDFYFAPNLQPHLALRSGLYEMAPRHQGRGVCTTISTKIYIWEKFSCASCGATQGTVAIERTFIGNIFIFISFILSLQVENKKNFLFIVIFFKMNVLNKKNFLFIVIFFLSIRSCMLL